jgi:RNA polymerase sigma-70 factor (sigma-E family)
MDVSEISMPDVAAGAEHSFDAFYSERWLSMVRLATLTTGSTSLAEEIVQDAFVQLHRNWTRVHNPSAWLRTAVVNHGRSWVRRQVLERRHQLSGTDVAMPDEGVVVRAALDRLSSRQRAAIVLRFYADLPEAEIAEVLGCRPGTVKSLLDRAKTTLRKELQQ